MMLPCQEEFPQRPVCPRTKKVRYATRKNAVTAAHHLLRPGRRHKRPEDLKVYECPHCAGWHLGKRVEADFKLTRAQKGARRRKFSRRDHREQP